MTKDIKPMKIVTALIMCIGLMFAVFTISASAASKAVKWDGKTALEKGMTYVVTDIITIKKDFVIPEGTKLSVKEGGMLKIANSGSLSVYGELAVAVGGTLKNSGTLNIKKYAYLNVYGLLQSSVSGTFNISGNVTVYNRGVLETSSAMKVYTSAYIYNKGNLAFYKSSDVKFSGKLETNEKSDLELRGIMQISVSGKMDINGHLTVGAAGNIRLSGTMILTDTSTYTRFTTIHVTSKGKFTDQRPKYAYEDMTVDVLVDEPDVKLNGIDVSYAQGEIDWKKVANSGIDFAIIRAGRGRAGKDNTMKEDDYFRRNIEEAQKYGIDVGVYFYSYATNTAEAIEEAEFFVQIIDGYKIQYPVILDMEETFQGDIGKETLTEMIDGFFGVLMKHKYFPMFYSYKAWIEQFLDMTVLDKYAVWLAQVNDKVTYDGGYYIWQYSFTGKVSGIKNGVDLDISYKNWAPILRKYHLNNL